MQYFIDDIQNKKYGIGHVLIIDDYCTHITILLHNLDIGRNDVLFQLSYTLQPIDVEGFSFFSQYHTDAIDKTVRLGNEKFS